MRNRMGFNNFLKRDRKTLYIILSIVMISVLTLTVVYAALSTTLNINGQAEVSSASWDIYLDNVVLNSSSATTTAPTITNARTATFTTTLSKPGDFYEFTIDVVNDGSIDAMIDSVTKTPELSDTQKKYLNYIVEYQNGEPITTKQLVSKKSFVRLKVKVEFRKDITASDLPTTSETLDLSFIVNYVQADETGTGVKDDGVKKSLDVVNGDLETVGSEVCIGQECFYIISSDDISVTMLAKYNLYVGNYVEMGNDGIVITPIESPTGIQDSRAIASRGDGKTAIFPWIGATSYSSTYYWWDSSTKAFKTNYPVDTVTDETSLPYVYDSNSSLYMFVQNYKTYLEGYGVNIQEARLIKLSELLKLGCSIENENCTSSEWVYGTSYWTGTASDNDGLWGIDSSNALVNCMYSIGTGLGIRPVITIVL